MNLRPPAGAIAITGFMGTGKTTVARIVAERLGLEMVDTDELIEAEAGMSIPAIFAAHGEAHFRDLESAALAQALGRGRVVIGTGGGMLLRAANLEALRRAGPIICLTASPDAILRRVGDDDSRPLLQVADPAGRIAELLAERRQAYAQADAHVDTTQLSPEQAADEVLRLLADDPRARWLTGARTTIPVALADARYEITVGCGVLDEVGALWPPREPGVRAALVTTDRIAPLLAKRTTEALRAGGWEPHLLVVPDGEASKSLAVLGELYEGMAAAGLDRGGTVFALGGGVVGDLAGFAAATWMRGIDLVNLPTTLLAQVDSSIGGKTAIDLSGGKNLVGAFHQPVAVVSDVGTLATLPPAEMRSGLGEIIKHACCFDAEMFALLERRAGGTLADDTAALEYLVSRNCQIKAGIVEEDPHEQGVRAVLNYGHTVGHALERAAEGWSLRHGEVVGAGIVAESRLAAWLGVSDEETALRQERLVAAWGLPTSVSGIDEEAALAALARDKKIVSGRLRLPLVPEVGSFRIVEDVSIDLLRRAVRSVLAEGWRGDARR